MHVEYMPSLKLHSPFVCWRYNPGNLERGRRTNRVAPSSNIRLQISLKCSGWAEGFEVHGLGS